MNQSSSSDLAETRATVSTITDLITMLHPVITPSIYTVYDFDKHYRDTGLNEHAQSIMTQSRREVGESGNYILIGLCEFHTGLIRLHWGDCHAAEQRFAEARYQWQFSNETASICLTYFAEGRACQHSQRYEAAMGKYNKVEQWLSRIQISSTQTHNGFVGLLLREMQLSQAYLRQRFWAPSPPPSRAGTHYTPPNPEPTHDNGINDEPITQADNRANAGIAQPFITFNPTPERKQNMPPEPPMPGHQHVDPSYVWYKVADKQDEMFLPWIPKNSWVLVRPRPSNQSYQTGELIVIVKLGIERAGITLQQHPGDKRPFARIYLARSQFEGRFIRDTDTGAVQLSSYQRKIPVYPTEIEGLVVGFWRSVQYAE
jgi:hypothetical protein